MIILSKTHLTFRVIRLLFLLSFYSNTAFSQIHERGFKHKLFQGYSKMEKTTYFRHRTNFNTSSHEIDEKGNITKSTVFRNDEMVSQKSINYNEKGDITLEVYKNYSTDGYYYRQGYIYEYNDQNQIVKQISILTTDHINFDTTVWTLINIEADTLIEYERIFDNQSAYISCNFDFKNYTKTLMVYNLLNQPISKSIYQYYPNHSIKEIQLFEADGNLKHQSKYDRKISRKEAF